jgi:hypothetical protein
MHQTFNALAKAHRVAGDKILLNNAMSDHPALKETKALNGCLKALETQ